MNRFKKFLSLGPYSPFAIWDEIWAIHGHLTLQNRAPRIQRLGVLFWPSSFCCILLGKEWKGREGLDQAKRCSVRKTYLSEIDMEFCLNIFLEY